MRRAIAAIAAFGLAIGLAGCAPESTVIDLGVDQADGALSDDVQAQLQSLTETAMTAAGAPGAIVGVYAPWAGQWVAGLGVTEPEGAAVAADMTFKAPGVSRAMTCDVLYGLVERGTVDLDDTVVEWVETYPNAKDITLEQLCDGTSGIDTYLDVLLPRLLKNPERVWNARELAAYGLAKDRTFDPGTRYGESDTGYLLLGIVLERVTGSSLNALYQEFVFGPLGMSASSAPLNMPTDAVLNGFRSGTSKEGKTRCKTPTDVTALSPTAGGAAAGVVSDVDDLATYARALAAGARSYDTESRFADARTLRSQPSWFTADGGAFQAGSLVGQYGSIPGYLTAAFADRETGLAVVVVLNNSRASAALVRTLAWQLAAVASKAPAAEGRTAPESGLPWTAESLAGTISETAVCS